MPSPLLSYKWLNLTIPSSPLLSAYKYKYDFLFLPLQHSPRATIIPSVLRATAAAPM